MKNTIATLQQQKQSGDKITMLTAYDYSIAALRRECHSSGRFSRNGNARI